VIERFIEELGERLGGKLRAVWLFGSRARGEDPGPESDVDLLILSEGGIEGRRANRQRGDVVRGARGLLAARLLLGPLLRRGGWIVHASIRAPRCRLLLRALLGFFCVPASSGAAIFPMLSLLLKIRGGGVVGWLVATGRLTNA